ncbi:calcium-binding protein [Yoonia sp. 208BN28-4]|uniref:calcium-binding protein n=1 Tax=Yoonia sp. 208BN28-4 TaxID=3126505 RepID=UPI0030B4E012
MSGAIKTITDTFLENGFSTGAENPDLVATQSGGFTISFGDEYGADDFDARGRTFDGFGASLATFAISSSSVTLAATHAATTYLADGRRVSVWSQDQRNPTTENVDLYGRIWHPDGTADILQFSVSQDVGNQFAPLVLAGEDGGFAVAYADSPTGTAVMKFYNQNGGLIRTVSPANPSGNVSVSSPNGSSPIEGLALDSGNYVLTWYASGVSFFQIYDAGGLPVGATVTLGTMSTFENMPRMAQLEDGRFVVTYQTFNSIYAEIYDEDGTVSVSQFQVATDTVTSSSSASDASIAGLQDGRFVVVYVAVGSNGIKAQIVHADGTLDGAAFDVSSVDTGTQRAPTVSTLADGRFAVAWQTSETGTEEIKYAVFDPREEGIVLAGTRFDDSFVGTDFVDFIAGGRGDDTIQGQGSNDYLGGGRGNDIIYGGAGNDEIDAGAGNDVLNGDAGVDVLKGGLGADTIYGGNGDDIIYADEGEDVVLAGADDDVIYVGLNTASVDGGSGTDQAIYVADPGVTARYISLNQTGIAGSIVFDGVENFKSDSDVRFVFEGTSGANIIELGSGNDIVGAQFGSDYVDLGGGDDEVIVGGGQETFIGGSGRDTINYQDATGGIDINLETNAISGSWAVNDTIDGFEDFVAGANGNDKVVGTSGANQIQTRGGDDSVYAGNGADYVLLGAGDDYVLVGGGQEQFHGGADTDYISYYKSTGGIQIDLAADTVDGSWATNDVISGFEGVSGSATGGDTVNGTSGANVIRTYGGADRVTAGNGADRVYLGAGDDYVRVGGGEESFYGGSGKDYISYYDSSGGITLRLATDFVTGSWAVNDTIKDFESAGGSNTGNDDMHGTSGNNTLNSYGGNDTLFGLSGDDRLNGGSGMDFFDGGGGKDTLTGGADADTFHFDRGEGDDIIKDFENNIDTIELDNFSTFSDAAGALTFAVNTSGGDVFFDFGSDGTLLVENTTKGFLLNDLDVV